MQKNTPTNNQPLITVPVRAVVEFVCRSGDLMPFVPAGPSAQEGIRAHQKLQKQRPDGSEAEYRLQTPITLPDGGVVQLSGRVDILHSVSDTREAALLEEIKTTYCPAEKIAEHQRELHWAQLKLYGFCYACDIAEQFGDPVPTQIELQMLWYNVKTKKAQPELRRFSVDELKDFTLATVEIYVNWYRDVQLQQFATRDSARELAFPFPGYREGQRTMAVAVYRGIRDRQPWLIEAPTGIGKTVSSLYPALKAVGEGLVDKVVYLTAKNSGRQVVCDAVDRMCGQGLELSMLVLGAKDKTCACRNGGCPLDDEGVCPMTRGFYDRLPAAREALLQRRLMTPAVVADVAQAHQLCAFELSLHLLPWVTLVVCDFNYVFDPLVGLSYFQAPGERIALLVDEGHNLTERSRDMYSAQLNRSDALQAATRVGSDKPRVYKAIKSVASALGRWSRARETDFSALSVNTRPETVTRAANKLLETLAQLSEEGARYPEPIAQWLKAIYRYVCIEQLMAEQHKVVTRRKQGRYPEYELTLLCLNAADYLCALYKRLHSVTVFSATLRPVDYFLPTLGLAQDTQCLSLTSPFAAEQLGVMLCPYVDTRFRQREQAVDPIVAIVHTVVQSRAGNYLVFFPSYQFMRQVVQWFTECYPAIDYVMQEAGASEAEREKFLARFSSREDTGTTLGFAIIGGVFGEGVDYVGERLVGAIVIGVGLPQINEEQELIRQGFNNAQLDGFDYAYRYPGMTRVLQTAGRVIRTASDRGVLVLVDQRFDQPFYRALYPPQWRVQVCRSAQLLEASLSQFW